MSTVNSSLLSAELRLLRCTFSTASPSTPPPPPSLPPLIDSLLPSIESGRYLDALRSPDAIAAIFPFASSFPFHDSEASAGLFYEEAARAVEAFVSGPQDDDTWIRVLDGDGWDDVRACRVTTVMCIAVASLLAFMQRNMTGPVEEFPPLPLEVAGCPHDGGKWDVWARNQLTSSGSDLFGKISMIQYIFFAKMLLSKLKNLSNSCSSGCASISWWLLRVIILQQRILDELSSSLYGIVEKLVSETLNHYGELENIRKYWDCHLCEGEASSILSLVHLETGIIEIIYGRADSARNHFNHSEGACGLHLSLIGALGFRTIHQVDAKAQMVLVTGTDSQENGEKGPNCLDCQGHDQYGRKSSEGASIKQEEISDVLMTPRLLENRNGSSSVVGGSSLEIDQIVSNPLTATQQAVILAHCLHISRSNPDDELSRWKVAPFIEAVDAQKHSHFIIRCFCDILRIRWESTRSRTKQRAVVMMDTLVERLHENLPGAAQRVQLYFAVHMPTIPSLRKEHGMLLVGNGMLGEALHIFEDLELWDSLIHCHHLLGKKSAAVELINARLAEIPTDPKLWCALGDVTNTDSCYEKALEVSNGRSARAKRSLARSAYNRGDYERSKNLWESALMLNSLYPDGWFALGAAALKDRDIDKALDGFTRAVQLDPENGEAWNNIACLHMMKKHHKESFIAFKEALKFRRMSWQLWQNYSHVAFEVGNFCQALEGTKHVLDLTANKQIDNELLEKLTLEVEKRTMGESLAKSDAEIMLEMLGSVLQQIVKGTGGDGIWGLYGRWLRIKGDLRMCSEALMKEVRSYQGSGLWSNEDRFKKFARASLDLCSCYMEISRSSRSRRELSTADMHLRNSIKQAVKFSDTEEFRLLQKCLDDVRDCLAELSFENES